MLPDHPTIALDPIPGHPGYLACRLGVIFSTKQGKGPIPLRGSPNACGYLQVHEVQYPKNFLVYTHHLILVTYIGPRPEGMEARHLNSNRQDNRASNLAWGTDQENANDRIAAGTVARGERTNCTTLTPDDIPIIRSMNPKDAARRFGISTRTAYRIKDRTRWGHIP